MYYIWCRNCVGPVENQNQFGNLILRRWKTRTYWCNDNYVMSQWNPKQHNLIEFSNGAQCHFFTRSQQPTTCFAHFTLLNFIHDPEAWLYFIKTKRWQKQICRIVLRIMEWKNGESEMILLQNFKNEIKIRNSN